MRFLLGLVSPGMSTSSSLCISSRSSCRYSSRRASGLSLPASYLSHSWIRTLFFSIFEIFAKTFGSVPKTASDWNSKSDSRGVYAVAFIPRMPPRQLSRRWSRGFWRCTGATAVDVGWSGCNFVELLKSLYSVHVQLRETLQRSLSSLSRCWARLRVP